MVDAWYCLKAFSLREIRILMYPERMKITLNLTPIGVHNSPNKLLTHEYPTQQNLALSLSLRSLIILLRVTYLLPDIRASASQVLPGNTAKRTSTNAPAILALMAAVA